MEIIWDLTNKCNLRCKHCGAVNLSQHIDLKQYEIKKIVKYISSFSDQVTLLGGETLLHPYIFDILQDFNISNVSVKLITNGQLSDEYAKKLIEYGVDTVLISCDGLKEDNDLVRGACCWDKSILFLKSLLKYRSDFSKKSKVGLNCVINKYNYSKITDFINYFSDYNIDIIQFNQLLQEGNALKNDLSISEDLELEVWEKISAYVVSNKIRNTSIQVPYPLVAKYLNDTYGTDYEISSTNCTAGIDSLYYSPDGEISPCRNYSYESIKIINNKEPDWLWDYNTFESFFKKTCNNSFREDCMICQYNKICAPCPLHHDNKMPDICKLIYNKISSNSLFELIKPYSLIEANNKYYLYAPNIRTKTQYAYEGFQILKNLNKPISIERLSEITSYDKNIIYNFLLQENSAGKVKEIKMQSKGIKH